MGWSISLAHAQSERVGGCTSWSPISLHQAQTIRSPTLLAFVLLPSPISSSGRNTAYRAPGNCASLHSWTMIVPTHFVGCPAGLGRLLRKWLLPSRAAIIELRCFFFLASIFILLRYCCRGGKEKFWTSDCMTVGLGRPCPARSLGEWLYGDWDGES